MTSIPRGRAAAAIRAGRRGIGDVTPEPPPSPPASAPEPPKAPQTSRRRAGTIRLAIDVPMDLGERFRRRAKSRRFTQSEALTGALELLERLDDDTYERHLAGPG